MKQFTVFLSDDLFGQMQKRKEEVGVSFAEQSRKAFGLYFGQGVKMNNPALTDNFVNEQFVHFLENGGAGVLYDFFQKEKNEREH